MWINLLRFLKCLNELKIIFLCIDWYFIIYWGSLNIFWLTLQNLEFSFTVLESLRELKSFGWEKKKKRREEKQSALLLFFNCFHSSKWGLIIFNRENVAIEQFKIDLLKLTDYPILYHKRMHPPASFSSRNLGLRAPS